MSGRLPAQLPPCLLQLVAVAERGQAERKGWGKDEEIAVYKENPQCCKALGIRYSFRVFYVKTMVKENNQG